MCVCVAEKKVNRELEVHFTEEDSHLQGVLSSLQTAIVAKDKVKVTEACQRAKAEFIDLHNKKEVIQ